MLLERPRQIAAVLLRGRLCLGAIAHDAYGACDPHQYQGEQAENPYSAATQQICRQRIARCLDLFRLIEQPHVALDLIAYIDATT
jgi:hypothetical protein